MNRTVTLFAALGALALPQLALAQAAAPAPASAVAPQAVPAKVALINFEQVVLASNEGQTVTIATQKKYEPKKTQIEALAAEVDNLKKGLQALPANTSDEDRASKINAATTKEKQLNRDAEDAQTAYNTEWQEALAKVAQKLAATMRTYAQANGYTLLLDVSSQSSNVLWALPSTDVSQAVVDAYNKASGVAAPPPQSPRPATGATRPAPTRSATPKPAGK